MAQTHASDQHHQTHKGKGTENQDVGQPIQAVLQWGIAAIGSVDHFGDLAQLGGHTRGADDCDPATAHHFGALKHTVLALQNRCGGIEHQVCLLEHRLCFSC